MTTRVARLRLKVQMKPTPGVFFGAFTAHVWSDGSVHLLTESQMRRFFADVWKEFVKKSAAIKAGVPEAAIKDALFGRLAGD